MRNYNKHQILTPYYPKHLTTSKPLLVRQIKDRLPNQPNTGSHANNPNTYNRGHHPQPDWANITIQAPEWRPEFSQFVRFRLATFHPIRTYRVVCLRYGIGTSKSIVRDMAGVGKHLVPTLPSLVTRSPYDLNGVVPTKNAQGLFV